MVVAFYLVPTNEKGYIHRLHVCVFSFLIHVVRGRETGVREREKSEDNTMKMMRDTTIVTYNKKKRLFIPFFANKKSAPSSLRGPNR